MTTPNSGHLLMSDVQKELAITVGSSLYLSDPAVEALAKVTSASYYMSALYGRTNRVTLRYTISTNAVNFFLNMNSLAGYIAGKTDLILTIGSGVYVYNGRTPTTGWGDSGLYGGALNVHYTTDGDTLMINNNGYIIGAGGNGGSGCDSLVSFSNPSYGGAALCVSCPTVIDNTNPSAYIAGGGGGGGGGLNACGGGGAGGVVVPHAGYSETSGNGGSFLLLNGGTIYGGKPNSLGAAGNDGIYYLETNGSVPFGYDRGTAGAGGCVLPGVGGGFRANSYALIGLGGGAGGGGGGDAGQNPGSGGSANNPGGAASGWAGGGGGGWGAKGGDSHYYNTTKFTNIGGAGGNAIVLNGNSVTFVNGDTSRIYGAIS